MAFRYDEIGNRLKAIGAGDSLATKGCIGLQRYELGCGQRVQGSIPHGTPSIHRRDLPRDGFAAAVDQGALLGARHLHLFRRRP